MYKRHTVKRQISALSLGQIDKYGSFQPHHIPQHTKLITLFGWWEYGRFLPLSHATTHEMDGFVWRVGKYGRFLPYHILHHMKWMALFGWWGIRPYSPPFHPFQLGIYLPVLPGRPQTALIYEICVRSAWQGCAARRNGQRSKRKRGSAWRRPQQSGRLRQNRGIILTKVIIWHFVTLSACHLVKYSIFEDQSISYLIQSDGNRNLCFFYTFFSCSFSFLFLVFVFIPIQIFH